MDVLLYSFYFPPDGGGGGRVAQEISESILLDKHNLTVVCGLPHYPECFVKPGYRGKLFFFENKPNLKIIHCFLIAFGRQPLSRVTSFATFLISSSFALLFEKKPDLVLVDSFPPIFGGFFFRILSMFWKVPSVYLVAEKYPEALFCFNSKKKNFVFKILDSLENHNFSKYTLIRTVSEDTGRLISRNLVDKSKILVIPDGVDTRLFRPFSQLNARINKIKFGFKESDFVIMYVGTIGFAQSISTILLAAESLKKYKCIKFVICGVGPRLHEIVDFSKEKNLSNTFFFDCVSHDELPHLLSFSDICLESRVKNGFFAGFPCKIYEYMAVGKPVLLAFDGEAGKKIMYESKSGFCIPPEDPEEMAKKICWFYKNKKKRLELGRNARKYVVKHFSLERITKMYGSLLSDAVERYEKV